MNTVFFGSGSYVIPIIETLDKNFDLQLVVTTEKNPTDPVPQFCKEHKIEYISLSSSKELLNTKYNTPRVLASPKRRIQNTNSPVAVVASFGLIIPQDVIDIFPKGIINIHPSYLPYYRGMTPIQTALANGDTETAVSIMVIDNKMDHGPLLSQLPLAISSDDTTESLYTKAFALGAEKLIDVLPAYVAGNIEPRDQDHTKATFTPSYLKKEDGYVDLSNPPTNLSNLIRAYYPWPGVWTKVKINGQEKILKLLPNVIAMSETTKQSLSDRILFQMEGKKPVSKKDLLNGYPDLKEVIEKIS